MAIASETLRRLGITDTPDIFESVVSAALSEVLGSHTRTAAPTNLTVHEQDALRRGGLKLNPKEWGGEDPLLVTAAEYAVLVGSGYTVAQAADLLSVDPSRVRQRLGTRTLYGVKDHGVWRLPRFQFTDDGLVPNIELVIPRLREGVHPVGVWRWFTLPNSDLTLDDDDEKRLSPREWLCAGMDPKPVADLAAEL